ncbi:hypothetical protein M422DRAFT_783564 [Sphaerobolus stellatus SS14]|uniref:Uncharacterized protein n=1 Tax=Sphaerobolus stellatus (strain SS14) TaxID=990650 RepID=A0A0C9UBW8_SPHS4|nr:hypothetical protein M422DRAFT_783564 [Sphaerobolus stellatus SS14]
MPLHNVTVEDSSPLVVHRNISQWMESKNASDYRQYSGPSDGFSTNHNTSQVATVDFAFKGSTIYIFGSTGPTHGPFNATLIPNNNFSSVSDCSLAPANSIENTTSTSFSSEINYKQVLFSRTGLNQSVLHLLSLTNSGEGLFILDYFMVETDYQGSSIAAYILDDTNPSFSYSKDRITNSEILSRGAPTIFDSFNNNTIHYTLNIGTRSAVHGTWFYGNLLATLDDQQPVSLNLSTDRDNNPREFLHYAENLGEKEHTLTLVNAVAGRASGLGIDYAVITTTNLSSVPSNSTAQINGSLSNSHEVAIGSMVALIFMFFQILHLLPARRR